MNFQEKCIRFELNLLSLAKPTANMIALSQRNFWYVMHIEKEKSKPLMQHLVYYTK